MRRVYNMENGARHAYGAAETGETVWKLDNDGCCAELALAKYLNLSWTGTVGNYDAPDVGGLVDARSTHHVNGRLRITKKDPDYRPVVLVITRPPFFDLIGWLFAYQGKREEWWTAPQTNRFNYFVPRSVPLASMRDLQVWVNEQRILQEGADDHASPRHIA
jgi:hypothetical protein